MKQIILMIGLVALVGCGKKPTEDPVFEQGRPDVTKPSKPPANNEVPIDAANKEFAELKAKAEAGDAKAQCALGNIYFNGVFVEVDIAEAVKWFRKAATQGDADAQNELGGMYLIGRGVPEDILAAYALLSIADANNHVGARLLVQTVASEMTPEQFVKAKALANQMVANNPRLLNRK